VLLDRRDARDPHPGAGAVQEEDGEYAEAGGPHAPIMP
jgi:hypothetical protein